MRWLHHMLIPLPYGGIHGIPQPFMQWSHLGETVLHRQLGSHLFSSVQSYGLMDQYIHKALNKSMFDNYQQVTYSQRPSTACWTESWCWSLVVIYTEKMSSWNWNSDPVTCLQDGHQEDNIPDEIFSHGTPMRNIFQDSGKLSIQQDVPTMRSLDWLVSGSARNLNSTRGISVEGDKT